MSCTNKATFDSQKWNEKGVDWDITDIRERMVDDLIESDTIIGSDQNQIRVLLGAPEVVDSNQWKYLVRERYKWDIDPVYIKYLFVEFDLDGIATSAEVKKLN